jgi:hypothetical protein
MANFFYDRRAERLTRDEKKAIETLKANGWFAIADVYLQDGIPEQGDGSPTYRFEGRKPIGLFREVLDVIVEPEPETEPEEKKPKKRGRPRKDKN